MFPGFSVILDTYTSVSLKMSENSRIYPDWNPNALRKHSLPDCHWKLCLQFMDRHKNLLPQDQLCALAHIFANTQLLLRGDANQTMQLVLDLVKDQLPVETGAVVSAVEVDHVEKCCLEREAEPEYPELGPVGEMEALDISTLEVEVTVKAEPEEVVDASEGSVSEPDCPNTEMTSECRNDSSPVVDVNQIPPSEELKDTVPETKQSPEVATKFVRVVPATEPISMDNIYNNLILMDENFDKTQTYFNRLKCGRLELILKQNIDLSHTATVKIDQRVLAQTSAKKRAKAQTKVINQFFVNMRDHCYRIVTQMPPTLFQSDSDIVPRQTVQQLQLANAPVPINESNLGFRMLQKIGWTGGALGAKAQGRLDPVECSSLRKGRAGIGAVQEDTIDPAHYRQLMKGFQDRNEGRPLVFSAEFTNQECGELQRIASQLRLDGRVVTLPKGVKRFAVMTRELPPQEIVRRVLIEQDAHLSARYRVLPPKRSASFSKANPTPAVVPDCPRAPGCLNVSAGNKESAESEDDSQLSSEEEEPALNAASYNKILDSLVEFKPIRPLQSVEDVFHNCVLIGQKFPKTRREFNKVGSGSLLLKNQSKGDGSFCAKIFVGEFVLAEACDHNRKVAKRGAVAAFFKKANMFCYRLTSKNRKKDLSNAIPKKENPVTNIAYYEKIIRHFSKDCVEQELVFSAKFTASERKSFISIAHSYNLRATCKGSKRMRHLRVLGQCLPALAIVERIVVHNDPLLCERYEVTPPRIGARMVDGYSY